MIDTHAHLCFEAFDGDRGAVIERAQAAGLQALIHPGIDLAELPQVQALAQQYPDFVYFAGGIHPLHLKSAPSLEQLRAGLAPYRKQLVAIGETGLDKHHPEPPLALQTESFRVHCQLARAWEQPLIVHCRQACQETYAVLSSEGVSSGVMHCYTGDLAWAKRFIDLGFYISFAGPLTFRSAQALREVAAALPLERLLIETDAPYLAPTPWRGQRNEPAYVRSVAEQLAQLHRTDHRAVSIATSQNAQRLFGLRLPQTSPS